MSLLKSQEDPENMVMVVYFTIATFLDKQQQEDGEPAAVSFQPCEYRLLFAVSETTLSGYGKSLTIASKTAENIALLPDDILLVDQIDKELKVYNPIVYDNDNETRLRYNIGSMFHVNVLLNPPQIHSDSNRWKSVLTKLSNLAKNGQNKDIMECDMVVDDGTGEASAYMPN